MPATLNDWRGLSAPPKNRWDDLFGVSPIGEPDSPLEPQVEKEPESPGLHVLTPTARRELVGSFPRTEQPAEREDITQSLPEEERLTKAARHVMSFSGRADTINFLPEHERRAIQESSETVSREAKRRGVDPGTITFQYGTPAGEFATGFLRTPGGQIAANAGEGLISLPEAGAELTARLVGLDSLSEGLRTQRANRRALIESATSQGVVTKILGERGNRIFNAVNQSVVGFKGAAEAGAKLGARVAAKKGVTIAGAEAAKRTAANAAIYTKLVTEGFSRGLERAEQRGLEGLDATTSALVDTTIEGGITFLMGRWAARNGITDFEHSLSPALRRQVSGSVEKSGLRGAIDRLMKGSAGATAESVEESIIELGQQFNELVDTGGKADFGSFLEAAIGGAAARGATGVVNESKRLIRKLETSLPEQVKGVFAAEDDLANGKFNPRLLDPLNKKDFEQESGLKNTTHSLRKSYRETAKLYAQEKAGLAGLEADIAARKQAAEGDINVAAQEAGADIDAATTDPLTRLVEGVNTTEQQRRALFARLADETNVAKQAVRGVERSEQSLLQEAAKEAIQSERPIADRVSEFSQRKEIASLARTRPLELTQNAAQALRSYIASPEGSSVNFTLRSGKPLSDNAAKLKTAIENVLTVTPPYGGPLYRGLSFDTPQEFESFMQGISQGGQFSDPAFFSTSKSPEVAREFATRIGTSPVVLEIADASNGRDVQAAVESLPPDKMSRAAATEQEVMYPPGFAFQVDGVRDEGGVTIVTLSESPGAEAANTWPEIARWAADPATKPTRPHFRTVSGMPPVPPPGTPVAASSSPGGKWDPLGNFTIPRGLGETVDRIKDQYRKLSTSIVDELRLQANRLPEHQRPRGVQLTNELTDLGERAVSEKRNIAGELFTLSDPLLKQAGAHKFSAASRYGQSDGRVVELGGGAIRGIESNLRLLVENRGDRSQAPKNLLEAVDKYKQLINERGKIAEREGVVQGVPDFRQESRRQDLGAMPEQDLRALFERMLPESDVPSSKEGLVNAMAFRDFFKNRGGDILTRIKTGDGLRMQPGHPAWDAYQQLLAHGNDIEPQVAAGLMNDIFVTSEGRTAVEIPRVLQYMPDAVEVGGKRYQILEDNLFHHVDRSTDSFTTRMGNIRVFGQSITQPDLVAKQDHFRAAAVQAGLDEPTTTAFFDAIAGRSLRRAATGEAGGGFEETNMGVIDSVIRLATTTKMSAAAIANITEPLKNIRAFGGNRRLIESYAIQLGRDTNNARADVRRAGAYVPEYMNLTLDRPGTIDAWASKYGTGVLKLGLVDKAWNQQAEQAAIVGKLLADDFRAGVATKWDRDNVVRWLRYRPEQAQRFYGGEATDTEYVELIQRFASRATSARITNPAEESRIRGEPFWRRWMPLTRYSLLGERQLRDLIRSHRTNFNVWQRTGDPEALESWGRDWLATANWLGGAALSGAVSNLLREMFFFGPEEGFALNMRTWKERPVSQLFGSLASGQLGWILGTAYWGLTRDNESEAIVQASPVGSIISESMQVLQGSGRYRNMSAVDAAMEFGTRQAPLLRGAGTATSLIADYEGANRFLAPWSLGQRDRELDAARLFMFRYLDGKGRGPGSGSPGGLTDEQAAFQVGMKKFAREAQKREPLSPERLDAMQGYLMEALNTGAKDGPDTAKSIRGRKLLSMVPKDLLPEFAEKFPEDYEKLLAHDYVLEQWAAAVNPPKRHRRTSQ